ncbi:MAG TPA: hypothetical protein VF116_02050 [Ktedonobacterales bacterium]
MQQSSSGHPAMKWGIIFGIVIGALSLINVLLRFAMLGARSFATGSPFFGGFGCLFSLIGLALLFISGILAARESGKVGTGAIAGLIAGLIGGVVSAIVTIVAVLSVPFSYFVEAAHRGARGSALTPGQIHNIAQIALVVIIIAEIVAIGVEGGIGAGLGALGGLIGKGQRGEAPPGMPPPLPYQTPYGTPPPPYTNPAYPPQATNPEHPTQPSRYPSPPPPAAPDAPPPPPPPA